MRASSERVRIGRQTFQLSDLLGGTYDANAADRRAVLDAVTASAREADLTIFTIHAHETASSAGPRGLAHISPGDDPVPADFLPPLFRKAIDAGAAMVVRHGPHTLNGIEIYKGRPIFYSLGSLFFDFRGRRSYRVPGTGRTLHFPDHWFESAVATVRYRGGELVEVRLYPVMIEVSPYPTNGLPLLATGADAQRILARLQLHSAPFGTQIRIEGDVGVISGPAS
jgi:poly-gamma-glutamate synthesis protein (capsule biosynthesis protein)